MSRRGIKLEFGDIHCRIGARKRGRERRMGDYLLR